MSAWRKKAIEILPEERKELEDPQTSIYGAFSCMLAAVHAAHEVNDTERLKKIYGFAEWCFYQKSKDIWNAAGVGFYEHLGDRRITFEAIPKWVKPGIYKEIKVLLELFLKKEDIRQLDEWYKIK